MFLKILAKRFSALGAKETGTALIGVLGIMGVSSAVAVTSTSMSIHAVGFTSSTRAGVQAEAAAEAGVDFAAASLTTSICQSQYSNATDPIFHVTISYSTLSASPGDIDNSWVTGCPTNATAARLKLVSTGWASSNGVAGNSSDDIRRVEAIYPYTPTPPASSSVAASGGAMYSFNQSDPTINNLTVTQGSTTKPTIQFLFGSVTCTSGTIIKGDLILGQGTASIMGHCTVDGDLYATSDISITSGEVTGNVISYGTSGLGTVSVASASVVDGSIFASRSVSISGNVGGNIVAGPQVATSTFSNKSSVGGSVVTAGTVTAAAGSIKGTVTSNHSGIVTPSAPGVPHWVDFDYHSSDWVTSAGSPYSTINLSSCTSSALTTGLNAAQNSSVPTILDTRICGANTDFSGNNLSLVSDTVIIANGFKFSSNDIQSSNSSEKRLWVIIPDSTPNQTPTCGSGSTASVGNHVTVGPKVSAFIYSPCAISNSQDVWRGQMYSSSISTSSSFSLSFVPIGLPTVDLSTGEFLSSPGTGVLGDRTSIRDLTMN
jgi:hypothetical protein